MLPARVEADAAGVARERHQEEAAPVGIARHDFAHHGFEVLSRLLVGPVRCIRRQGLQAKRRALRVTRIAAGQALAFVQEHRLDAGPEHVVVERRGAGSLLAARGGGGEENGEGEKGGADGEGLYHENGE